LLCFPTRWPAPILTVVIGIVVATATLLGLAPIESQPEAAFNVQVVDLAVEPGTLTVATGSPTRSSREWRRSISKAELRASDSRWRLYLVRTSPMEVPASRFASPTLISPRSSGQHAFALT
jgi:hypothetical protein